MFRDGVWTPEIIARFWDYIGGQPYSQKICFSNLVGKGIIKFLKASHCLKEGIDVLDFGCGPGFLLQRMLPLGLFCYGVDSSEEQINLVNEKFSNYSAWKGGKVAFQPPLPFPSASFDLIICVEVVEHLTSEVRDSVLNEIFRLLKPKGRALFTTPNNEDLEKNTVYCPFCDIRFHRRQHLHSLSQKHLSSMLRFVGFNILFCEEMDFHALQSPHFNISWKSWDLRFLVKSFRHTTKYIMDFLSPKPFPYGRVFRYRAACKSDAPSLVALVEKP